MPNSPFAIAFEREAQWVLWENKTAVLDLLEKPTDSLREDDRVHHSLQDPQTAVKQSAGIERQQYMSILNRMHQAAGRAGTFSAWNAELK